jgi:hypothetical protein
VEANNNEVRVTTSDGRVPTQDEKNGVAAQKLLDAAKLIETALVLLDMHNEPCGGCGSRHWRNLTHANVYQKLTDTPHRLRTSAASVVTSGESKPANNRRRHGRGNK